MFFKKRKHINHFRLYCKNIHIDIDLDVKLDKNLLIIYNNKNKFFLNFCSKIKIFKYNKFLFIESKKNIKIYNCLIGLYYSIIKNIISGFKNFFIKKLLLVGTGYKAIISNNKFLYLYLGFSHPVIFKVPDFLTINIYSNIEIWLSGIDKQKVFQIASVIKNLKKPDPYKGKGLRYLNENIILKEIKKK